MSLGAGGEPWSQHVAPKLQELDVNSAGVRWCLAHMLLPCYGLLLACIHTPLVASAPHFSFSFSSLFPSSATTMQLCFFGEESPCCQQPETFGPVWKDGVTACDWKWSERISGPAERERGIPTAKHQLVSRPANPAPSACHLLDPLSALINLSASHRSQIFCHSALSFCFCLFRWKSSRRGLCVCVLLTHQHTIGTQLYPSCFIHGAK